ncbi:McrB family protein [Emticicia sp. C21]|uniref:McrB family protein n=1 Tax=Emticicia sp. C21 TaxID=2302915 RepID=UPI000E3517CC|nr:AAA family ATPase [Emticicia sp. C21]RFS17344.1 hypothetical protein D0T08_06075 [Emticicia sp. C21]
MNINPEEYIKQTFPNSPFNFSLSTRGGYITFSNSGIRGIKSFSLGLDTLIQIFKDILEELNNFAPHTRYDETLWRNLESRYYTDNTANSISTVQTKPLFSTISKIIAWANYPLLDNTDVDNIISLDESHIKNTINKLEELAETFNPVKEVPVSALEKAENIIYYGSPGTGKSYKVNEILKPLDMKFYERVTFHPEYDHASFVGTYKPTTENEGTMEQLKYKFVPQVFTNIYIRAWQDQDNQYYLAIEEINRGNCAEIFGDIFQLLDRTSNYTVTPDEALKKHLINELGPTHDGVVNGLKLPPNLSLLATMNTSDQSLFPMDSAFKRRWDWEYIPICYTETYELEEGTKENESFKYLVKIGNEKFKWIDFIEAVNKIIRQNENLGMDKCIGNYFIKSDTNEISLKEFINKAIFYLWNDVFKDEEEANSIFKRGTFYEDFFPIGTNGLEHVKKILDFLNVQILPLTPTSEESSD